MRPERRPAGRWAAALQVAGLAVAMAATSPAFAEDPRPRVVTIGSKVFPESRLLAELMAQLIEARTDLKVVRKPGLGGTLVVYEALTAGEIDLYPEYTGTAWATMLHRTERVTDPMQVYVSVDSWLRAHADASLLPPFGFNNSYALAMREDRAAALGIRTISQLADKARDLNAGVSVEFLKRLDCYPGLKEAYGLAFGSIRGVSHGLVYEAIKAGEIDVTDVYSTDGKLVSFNLRVLEDDRRFFPPYDAVPMVRLDTLARYPELRGVLSALAYRIDDQTMQHLNDEVIRGKRSFAEVARGQLIALGLVGKPTSPGASGGAAKLGVLARLGGRAGVTLRLVGEHILLTAGAVVLACLVAIPLGIWIRERPRARDLALGAAGVTQTIPSLALLALLIPIPGLGLGWRSALLALFLYALLPILRNTYTGLTSVDPSLIEAAQAIGLTERQRLFYVGLPLAARTIMAGVRTSAVIGVGVTTLAAFVGAGGLGQPIITGLHLNDGVLILSGALPAAALALLVDRGLGWVECWVAARGS